MTGGSAEQGNAKISGTLNGGEEGTGVIQVRLVAETFNPFNAADGVVCSTATDSAGKYEFGGVPFGSYYLYAFTPERTRALLDGPYTVAGDGADLFGTILGNVSVISVIHGDSTGGQPARFYVRGMPVADGIEVPSSRSVKLTGVPAGVHDIMKYDPLSNLTQFFTRNLEIAPGDSLSISLNNRPPRIRSASDVLPETVFVDTVYSFRIVATDPDSDRVVYRLKTSLQAGTVDSINGVLSWTPALLEIPLSHVNIETADPQGAYSVFTWNITVRNNGRAPVPDAPGGSSECMAESMTVYTAKDFDCLSTDPLIRFSWGDGDTSAFSTLTSMSHVWSYPGTYRVGVQVQCGDYALSSPWSPPLEVTVQKSKVTPIPSFADTPDTIVVYGASIGYDTIFVYDSILGQDTIATINTVVEGAAVSLSVVPISCDSIPLYRFFRNGEVLTDWGPETEVHYVPQTAGIDELTVEAWCDTATALPSGRSEKVIVFVKAMQ